MDLFWVVLSTPLAVNDVVLHVDVEKAKVWKNQQLIEHWSQLCKG
jgi:hypothetical protein